jgi:endonuclease/exonuclease/phosphatase (EEP) superfamily protein YafD
VLRAFGSLGFLGFLGATALVGSARWFWLGEVATSFSWQLGCMGLVGVVALGATRRPRLAALTLVLALLHMGPELLLWLPSGDAGAETGASSEVLTLAACNLLWENENKPALASWLDEADPDIVAFEEVSPAWRAELESLSGSYPYLVLSPPAERWSRGTWGTAFLSRVPLTEPRWIEPPPHIDRPHLEVQVTLGAKPLTLRVLHPPRPGRPPRVERRNSVLDLIAEQDWSGQAILLGDLNTTRTSPTFGRLLEATGLRDSRKGFGRQPTFTTARPIPGFEIAIDHVLVSEGVRVLDRRTLALAGSDHRSVVVRVAAR